VNGESRLVTRLHRSGDSSLTTHGSLFKVNDQMNKNAQRLRRAVRSRAKIRELKVLRLSVHRTPQHIYAQIFDADSKVLAVASTLQKDVREGLKGTGNATAAAAVGKAIAEKAKAAGITQVAFDRSGFKYHGRIKALADAARENGLEF
jgi:large subunit ribosomal protein L18